MILPVSSSVTTTCTLYTYISAHTHTHTHGHTYLHTHTHTHTPTYYMHTHKQNKHRHRKRETARHQDSWLAFLASLLLLANPINTHTDKRITASETAALYTKTQRCDACVYRLKEVTFLLHNKTAFSLLLPPLDHLRNHPRHHLVQPCGGPLRHGAACEQRLRLVPGELLRLFA